MIKYKLKEKVVSKPEMELPEGSQVVSVKHHGSYTVEEDGAFMPECWQVIWLEPIAKQ